MMLICSGPPTKRALDHYHPMDIDNPAHDDVAGFLALETKKKNCVSRTR
jgi:hypothetical protein